MFSFPIYMVSHHKNLTDFTQIMPCFLMKHTISKPYHLQKKSSNCNHHTLGSWEKQFSTFYTPRSGVKIMHRFSCFTPEGTCELKLVLQDWIFLNSEDGYCSLSACWGILRVFKKNCLHLLNVHLDHMQHEIRKSIWFKKWDSYFQWKCCF